MVEDHSVTELCEELLHQAEQAWKDGHDHIASECAQSALALLPHSPVVLAFAAALAEVMGNAQGAVEHITLLASLIGPDKAATSVAEYLTDLNSSNSGMNGGLRAAFVELELEYFFSPIKLQGYATDPIRIAKSQHSPLSIQAVMIEDHRGARALWLAADLFGFDPTMIEEIRAAALLWGISSEAVILNATHTHYAPGTIKRIIPCLGEFDERFSNYVVSQIMRAFPILRQKLKPARLEVAQTHALCGVFRRIHTKEGKIIREIAPNQDRSKTYDWAGLARISWPASGSEILMVNLACHPTEMGSTPVLSGAFPQRVRKRLKQSGKLEGVLYFQGFAGDHKPGIELDGQLSWPKTHDHIEILVEQVSAKLEEALTQPFREITGELHCSKTNVSLELDPFYVKGEEETLDELMKHYRGDPMEIVVADWMQTIKANPSLYETELPVELIHHRLGDWSITGLSGEPVSSYARWLHHELGHDHFALGYTNGLSAYLPDETIVHEGWYEGCESQFVYLRTGTFKPKIEEVLKEEVLRLGHKSSLPRVMTRRPIQLDLKSDHRAFFVLSTGRSGTQTLAHLLDAAQNAKVWHHPEPNMIMETLYAYQDRIDEIGCFWRGRSHIICQAWEKGLIHGETDHNMTPFAPAIAEDIPNARFLVLVRDPREFIRSGMRRGYYRSGGAWDQGRLKPLPKQAKELNWGQLHPFEKVCWLWAETYRHINRTIEKIGAERVMIVRFEDLVSGPQVAQQIFEFLELEGFTTEHTQKVLSQKLNAQRGGEFPHPREWSQDLHDVAWRYCGEIAQGYGYPQRYAR